jgi:hypothetical protein
MKVLSEVKNKLIFGYILMESHTTIMKKRERETGYYDETYYKSGFRIHILTESTLVLKLIDIKHSDVWTF